MEELLQDDEPDPRLLDSMTLEEVEWALASVQFLLETGFPYPYDMICGFDEEQQKEMEESNQEAREALLRATERLLKMRERLLRKGATSGG